MGEKEGSDVGSWRPRTKLELRRESRRNRKIRQRIRKAMMHGSCATKIWWDKTVSDALDATGKDY